jgi:hypothetical protein
MSSKRCKKNSKKCCDSSSSSSKCSSSSSSGCCDSSSSSSEDFCCDGESSESLDLCSYKQSSICPKTITTYSVKTCLLEYKPRYIEVGSGNDCKYPTLDCALASLRERKGGYVIKLKPGIHVLTQDCCLCVDDLTIIGDDDCAFSGFFFMQGGNHQIVADFETCGTLCPYDKVNGEGPFVITSSGRRFIVKGAINPDFSCLCEGRIIGIVHRNGTITQGEVTKACGNTIMVSIDIGFGDDANSGEGFFIYPNVILSAGTENVHITTTGKLTFEGVVFDGSDWTIGSLGSYTSLRRCVSEIKPHLHITGRYSFNQANTFLGTLFLAPASSGVAFYQSVVGFNGLLLVDSSGTHSWKYGFFCSANIGARLINSCFVNFKGSQFVNCVQGISANSNVGGTIYSTYFLGNKYAIVLLNRCTFSSIASDNSPMTNYTPIFRENGLCFIANIASFIIIPNCTLDNNNMYGIIDATSYPTAESNYCGQFGRAGSLIIDSANISNIQAAEVDIYGNTIVTAIPAATSTTVSGTGGGPMFSTAGIGGGFTTGTVGVGSIVQNSSMMGTRPFI